MNALVQQTEDFDPRALGARCDECPLKGKRPVPPAHADGKLRLIIIGEAPGRVEVNRGAPFLGPSGRLLEKTLKEAGLYRYEAHTTNAMCCQPDDDANDTKLAAISCCAPRLAKELAALPKEIPTLALGAWAAKATVGARSIMKARGFVWTADEIPESKIAASKKTLERMVQKKAKADRLLKKQQAHYLLEARATYAGRVVVPSVHPAFILRGADGWFPVLKGDVRRLVRVMKGEFNPEDEAPYSVVSTPEAVRRAVAQRIGR